MTDQNIPLLRRDMAADFLSRHGYPMTCQTLARAAVQGWGPAFVLWGRRPLYHPNDLLAWAQQRAGMRRTSTSGVAHAS